MALEDAVDCTAAAATETAAMAQAINDAGIHQVPTKPWYPEQRLLAARHCARLFQLARDDERPVLQGRPLAVSAESKLDNRRAAPCNGLGYETLLQSPHSPKNASSPIISRKALCDTHARLALGGGGRALRDLIDAVFTSVLQPPGSEDLARQISNAPQILGAHLAFTTAPCVITPRELPGGDIGMRAVCGTGNDLAVGGAKPHCLAADFGIEEACEIALLRRIVANLVGEQLPRIC